MRITNSMTINTFLRNVSLVSGDINKYQNQISTGKLYQYASEAPIAAAQSIRYKSRIAQLEQNQANIDDANEILKVTDTALESYDEILTRISELSTQAANVGTMGKEDRDAIKVEIEQLKKEIISLANTQYNGRYIFSGYKTDSMLLDDDGKYKVDVITRGENTEAINYNIGFGSKLQVNTLGPDVFGDASEEGGVCGIIGNINELISAMDNADANAIIDAGSKINQSLQISVDARADVGARMNRLALTKNRVENSTANLEEALSLNDDAEYTETLTKWTSAKSVYQASLATGSKILQVSLLNYL